MTPALEHYDWIVLAYWLLMIPIAAAILYKVAGFCTDDYPTSFRRAVLMVLATAAVVFFTYDLSGYFFALWMRDPAVGVVMPPGYTYWDWLREPLAVKWHVLSFVPFIRFLPVGFALIAGCVLQIFLWNVPFKLGAVVFVAQVVLTLVAMELLSLAFRFGIELYDRAAPPPRPAHAAAETSEHLSGLAKQVQTAKAAAGSVWHRLDAGWESVNGHLTPLYRFLQPVTNHLPYPVQDFLNAGGWVLVLVGVTTLAVFWPRVHRNRKEFLKPRGKRAVSRRILLAQIGDSVSGLGPRQATVNGTPARLRLVVAAAAVEPLPELLDAILPGLGQATAADYPRVEVWADRSAHDDFRGALVARVEFPDPVGEPSRWVLLTGPAPRHGVAVPVALGFIAAKPVPTRVIDVPAGGWRDVVGIRDVPVEERE
jgi:hypothetical protein